MTCTYADCRVPPSRHNECAAKGLGKCWSAVWLLGVGGLQHQHTPKRSQGGKECWVMLCAGHHDAIDNGVRYEGLRMRDGISRPPNDIKRASEKVYIIWDRDSRDVLVEIPLGDSDTETLEC